MPEVDDFQKQRWRDWERAVDHHTKAFEYHNGAQERFAAACIKSLELTAAGGIFATLAFYSANYERLQQSAQTLRTFNLILLLLFIALFLALLTAAAAYFSQMAYAAAINKQEFRDEPPYVADNTVSLRRATIGNVIRICGICLAFTSLGFLTAAGWHLIGLLG